MLVTNGTDRKIKLVFYKQLSMDDFEVEEEIVLNPNCSVGAAFLKGRAFTIEDYHDKEKIEKTKQENENKT